MIQKIRIGAVATLALIAFYLLLASSLANVQNPAPYTPMPPERARQVIKSEIKSGSIPSPLFGWKFPSDFYVSGAWSSDSQMVIFAAAQPFIHGYFEPKNLIELVPKLRGAERSAVAEKMPELNEGLTPEGIEMNKHLLVFLLNGVFLSTVDLTLTNAELITNSEIDWEKSDRTIKRGGYFWYVSPAGILLESEDRKHVFLIAVPEGLDQFSYSPPIFYRAVLTTTRDGRPSISVAGRSVEFRLLQYQTDEPLRGVSQGCESQQDLP